jgi:Fe-S cluster assembly protein SufB
MPTAEREIETLAEQEYKYGFSSDIESETLPPGLNEDTVRFIRQK